MNFLLKYTKRILVLVAACMLVLGAVAGNTLAAYKSQDYARGVAANTSSETVRFTSNYLQNYPTNTDEKNYAVRKVVLSDSGDEVKLELIIYNYVSDNKQLVNQSDITYTLNLKFEGGSGSYTVSKNNEIPATTVTGDAYTTSSTLPGRRAYSDTYLITFPKSDLNHLTITASATPSEGFASATGGQMLAAKITPGTANSTAAFQAKSEIVKKSNSDKIGDYSAFNYHVWITSGKATATLKWAEKMEIDKFFLTDRATEEKRAKLKEANKTETDADIENKLKTVEVQTEIKNEVTKALTNRTFTFTMNQPEGTGDYIIPVYFSGARPGNLSWNNMIGTIDANGNLESGYLGFTATEVVDSSTATS